MSNFNTIIGAFCLSALAGLTACGTRSSDQGQNGAQTQPANSAPSNTVAAPAPAAALPQLLVAKVPVGSNGQELNDQAETREIATFTMSNEAALAAAPTPEEACEALVLEALENGAPDNVSVIVIDLLEA